MDIMYTLNDKFVPQVMASITSVCENNKMVKDITFYMVSVGISNENKEKARGFVKNYGRCLKIIELVDMNNYFDFQFDTMGWNPIVLARLLVGELLPENLDRVLYLDGDTIVRGDLSELWNTEMGECAIGASIEPTIEKTRLSTLNMEKYPYYNAGVLLLNMEKWRTNEVGNEIIKYYKENDGKLFANDQDAINGSQKGKIYTLSPAYNYYNIFDQYSYDFLKRLMNGKGYVSEKTFEKARRNPIIVHYLGEERPWRIGNRHKYKNDYIKYLEMTPWNGQNYEDGWQLYFLCWNIFNTFMKPFPSLRLAIINGLIPAFMKYRSRNLIKKNEK